MTKQNHPFWKKFIRFAKGIKLDSLTIGVAQFSFSSSEERASAFTEIRDSIDASKKDKPTDVFVVSAHNVDEVTVVDRIDADHECEALENPVRVAGGSGANTACALAQLGARVGISGVVGQDADGRTVQGALEDFGVDVQLMLMSPELPTGRTTTLVERSGKRLIVVYPGINNRFAGLCDEDRLFENARAARIVHLSSFVGRNEFHLQQRLLGRIGSHAIVSLTPGALYARQGLDRLQSLLHHVEIMFVYRKQLAQLVANSSASGRVQGNDTVDLLELFFAWRRKNDLNGAMVVVVKDPLESSTLTENERYLSVGVGRTTLELHIAAQPLPKDVRLPVVDTTGAGDAAAAGFLYGLLQSAPLEACIDFAFLLATFSSTELGPRTAFITRTGDPRLANVQRTLMDGRET